MSLAEVASPEGEVNDIWACDASSASTYRVDWCAILHEMANRRWEWNARILGELPSVPMSLSTMSSDRWPDVPCLDVERTLLDAVEVEHPIVVLLKPKSTRLIPGRIVGWSRVVPQPIL